MTNRDLIKATGLSYRELSERSGIPSPVICAIATNKAEPTKEFRRWMCKYISAQCRDDALKQMDNATRRTAVFHALRDKDMTARECAEALGFKERNAAAPRLTKLVEMELVEVAGKKKDALTGRTVSVYRRIV